MRTKSAIALLICLATIPFGGAALAGGTATIATDIGVALPTDDASLGLGGIWHLALGWSPDQSFALALQVGTAAYDADADRMMVVSGVAREVTLHAVSTVAVVARRAFGTGKLYPYLAAGVDLYTVWDDLRATASQPAETIIQSSRLGLQAGAGSGLLLSGHWDLYGEGLYHFATKAEDEARYFALQGGLRYHFGHRRTS